MFTGILRKPPTEPEVYIHHLPVTTEIARDAGVEFAGYPKFLAYIGFTVSISLSLMVLMFFLYYFPGLQDVVLILPLWEWVGTFLLSGWYFVVSLYLLIKKI